MSGTPPAIPSQFLAVDYGIADRGFQRKFTIIWASFLGFFILVSLPRLFTTIRNGTAFKGLLGITENWNHGQYQALLPKKHRARRVRRAEIVLDKLASLFLWCIPGFELNLGQVFAIVVYLAVVVVCIVTDAALIKNANRAGYMALAQLPVVFLFATKNSLLSLLLGPGHGYEKLNYIHKWSGRAIFFAVLLHGSLWIRDHLQYNTPILGQLKETSGIAGFALLCIIVLTSLRPVRRMFYEVFFVIHYLTFISFFIVICYHTPYAIPWIFPPLALFGLDLFMRMLRLRVKDAVLAPSDKQMTLIHVQDCTDGWTAGQHVRLRVFFSGRIFESHPFTMFTAPSEITCVTSMPQGINLAARVMGDWTQALNDYATRTVEEIKKVTEEKVCEDDDKKKTTADVTVQAVATKRVVFNTPPPDVPVQVMIDGPYGGCSIDLGRYETVLLFAGGAGATFTIGMLDDIVGRCVKLGRKNGEITKRVEFAWCIKSFGAIDWFAPALMDIATMAASAPSDLSVHISIYVTCLCNPEAVPPIPNCDVTIVRPSIYKVVLDLATPPQQQQKHEDEERPGTVNSKRTQTSFSTDSEVEHPNINGNRLPWVGAGGGLAVCAAGPESLSREAANAVARLQVLRKGMDVDLVGLHTEVFSL